MESKKGEKILLKMEDNKKMDKELAKTLWLIVAIDLVIVMIMVMHHFPKPPVM